MAGGFEPFGVAPRACRRWSLPSSCAVKLRRAGEEKITEVYMNKLKEIRLAREMTQAEVASKANVPQRTYQNYELGVREPGIYAAIRIADALGCDVKDIWGDINASRR